MNFPFHELNPIDTLIFLALFFLIIGMAHSLWTARREIAQSRLIVQSLELKLELSQRQLSENQLHVHFDYSTKILSSFFSDQLEVTYFYQLYRNKIPIGAPTPIKTDYLKVYDKDQIQKALSELASPLLQSGIKRALGL